MKTIHSLATLCLLSLAACASDTVKDTLGLSRAAPDEYRVISRPPLSVPPQFALRPPSTSDQPANQLPASKQAAQTVLGDDSKTPKSAKAAKPVKSASGADNQFLKNAGADSADPQVRNKLVEERYTVQDQQDTGSWWDTFFSKEPTRKEPTVDAKKESDRIKTNEDEGKPVTEGTTPEVKGGDTGVLGRIFGY